MASLITTLNCTVRKLSILFNNRTSITPNSLSFQPLLSFSSSSPSNSSTQITTNHHLHHQNKKKRGLAVVTRAAPTTTNLIFAFVFPLSLILVTVFTSIRIADKLDQDYLEELAINQAIMEGKDENEDSPTSIEEKPAELPRTRNRPKREA
ncbi:hypothetical protein BVC80_235g8 [Macleaya cordata]|uniref:High chlorophyll fluorescence 153 n=1 Tax=Macleaya cordata TaxID=56857 RepID=A0A200RB06_MACCD|nr:hypothetical protein BVC80_235g8 [Macleaya cordata]